MARGVETAREERLVGSRLLCCRGNLSSVFLLVAVQVAGRRERQLATVDCETSWNSIWQGSFVCSPQVGRRRPFPGDRSSARLPNSGQRRRESGCAAASHRRTRSARRLMIALPPQIHVKMNPMYFAHNIGFGDVWQREARAAFTSDLSVVVRARPLPVNSSPLRVPYSRRVC